MSLITILTVIFVISKIIGLISWSWWLVFSPVLVVVGTMVLLLAISLIVIIIACIIDLINYIKNNIKIEWRKNNV